MNKKYVFADTMKALKIQEEKIMAKNSDMQNKSTNGTNVSGNMKNASSQNTTGNTSSQNSAKNSSSQNKSSNKASNASGSNCHDSYERQMVRRKENCIIQQCRNRLSESILLVICFVFPGSSFQKPLYKVLRTGYWLRGESMEFQTVGIRQFNEYRKHPDTWVIDLRSKEEFEEVHVEGARNIPYEELNMFRKYLPKDKLYLLYCDRGSSSLMAAKELSRDGYRTATLVGGIQVVLQK